VSLAGELPWLFKARVVQFYYNYPWGELPYDDSYPVDFQVKTYRRICPERQVQLPRPAMLPALAFTKLRTQPAPSLPND